MAKTEDIYDITKDQSPIYWKHLEKDEIVWLIDVLALLEQGQAIMKSQDAEIKLLKMKVGEA